MRIKYPKAIQESEEELTRLEQRLRGQKTADRARMLRLLKSGTAKSLKDCAPMVGYSVSQLTRWGERYRAEGLAGVLKRQKPAGKASRLTGEAWAGLQAQMRAGHITTMQDARNYLERECRICATSWERVRSGSCWTVRAVIAAARCLGHRTCIRSICPPTVQSSIPPSKSFGTYARNSPMPSSRHSTSCKTP